MIRNVDFSEISDNRYYHLEDLCKVDTNGCDNCHECCIGMDDTIVLDPIDVFHISIALKIKPEQLINKCIDLSRKENIILPHLLFHTISSRCYFLSDEGRCKIHQFRPGICHLFPLGRIYHDSTFDYFLQTNQCIKKNPVKIKVRKWIDFVNIKDYEKYILSWHDFLKNIKKKYENENPDTNMLYEWNLLILKLFYFKPYLSDIVNSEKLEEFDMNFYKEYYSRLNYAYDVFNISSLES